MGSRGVFGGKSALVMFVFLALYGNSAQAQKWGKVTPEEWNMTAPADYPEANAVIIFDRGEMEVREEVIETQRHVRIKIFNKEGAKEAGDVGFIYDADDKISGLDAQTITPDGKKIKVSKKDIFEKSIRGRRMKTFSFPAADSGCIVEYKYDNINDRFFRLDPWLFQNDLYTLKSEFTLILAPGFSYSSSFMNMPGSKTKPVEQIISNIAQPTKPRKSFKWAMENLMPIKDEPYISFRKNHTSGIYCQLASFATSYNNYKYATDWSTLGDNFQDHVLKYYLYAGRDLKDLADSIVAGASEEIEKAKKIYRYVSEKYKSENDPDYHWFTNKNISGLFKAGYGTPDEKNMLLTELYRGEGLISNPVLVGDREWTVFIPQICQLDQFDHIVSEVLIDSTPIFVDAGPKYGSFGLLPSEYRTSGGFLINGKNSGIIKIQPNAPVSRKAEYTELHINHDGTAACTTKVEYLGYFAYLNRENIEKEKPIKFAEDSFLKRLNYNYSLDTPTFVYDTSGVMTMMASYRLNNAVEKLDNNLVIRPIRYFFRENPFKSEKRVTPVDFNYPMEYQSEIEVSTEDSVVSYQLPAPVNLAMQGLSFNCEYSFEGNKLKIKSKLAISIPIFPNGVYPKLKEFFDKVAATVEDKTVLTCQPM